MDTKNTMSAFFQQYRELKDEYKKLFERFPELQELTNMELTVFERLLTDLTIAEVGAALGISESTTKFHCKNIYRKLGIKSRAQMLVTYKDLY